MLNLSDIPTEYTNIDFISLKSTPRYCFIATNDYIKKNKISKDSNFENCKIIITKSTALKQHLKEYCSQNNIEQAVNDMIATINRFEKRIYDLKTTRIISIQMAPQIRLIQNNDSELVEKIQSSSINTIPLLKNQIVIALGITNAKNALGAQKQVNEMTNEMLKKNSELLKQGTIDIAEQSEKAVVDVETLQKTNKDIIDTLDKVLEIHENGKVKRQEAEQQLEQIEGELKDKLLEIKMENGK